jgi:hypothetical protein
MRGRSKEGAGAERESRPAVGQVELDLGQVGYTHMKDTEGIRRVHGASLLSHSWRRKVRGPLRTGSRAWTNQASLSALYFRVYSGSSQVRATETES